MTVYKVTPLFGEHTAQIVGMMQQTGTVVPWTYSDATYVRLPDGHLVLYEGWQPTPSEAWEAAGQQLDGIAASLRVQADACRTRATEEVLS